MFLMLREMLAHSRLWENLATMPTFTSTRQSQALFTARMAASLERLGSEWGLSLTTEKPYFMDVHEAYNRKIITKPNVVVLGDYDSGKSAFCKLQLIRPALRAGKRVAVFDRKSQQDRSRNMTGGEYQRLGAVEHGAYVVFDRRSSKGCHINILDPVLDVIGSDDEDTGMVGQDELLKMLAELGLEASLASLPNGLRCLRAAHAAALRAARAAGRIATLEDVVHALYTPTEQSLPGPVDEEGVKVVQRAGVASLKDMVTWGLPVADALERFLPGGDMSGLFDGPTRSADGGPIDLSNPLLIFDTSALGEGSLALTAVIMVATAWLQASWMRIPGQKLLFFEENYNTDLMPAVSAVQRAIVKRGRASGTVVVCVYHHLSDLKEGSDLWSTVRETDFVVCFQQSRDDDVVMAMNFFNLPEKLRDVLPTLQQGVAVVKVGSRPIEIVQMFRTQTGMWITDTDEAMSALTDNDEAEGIAAAGGPEDEVWPDETPDMADDGYSTPDPDRLVPAGAPEGARHGI